MLVLKENAALIEGQRVSVQWNYSAEENQISIFSEHLIIHVDLKTQIRQKL